MNDTTYDKFTLTALWEIYTSLYIFDLQEDTLFPIKTNPHIEKLSADFAGSQDKPEEEASERIDGLFDEIAKIHIEPMKEEISVSLGAVLYQDGLDFDSIYKIADRGVYDSKLNKGCSYRFQR